MSVYAFWDIPIGMNSMKRIRLQVFAVTQVEMAKIAKVAQAQVSRWESGHRRPSLQELARIRKEARRRRLEWDDAWFFDEVAA